MTNFFLFFFVSSVCVCFCQHCTILVSYNALVDQVVSRFVSISVLMYTSILKFNGIQHKSHCDTMVHYTLRGIQNQDLFVFQRTCTHGCLATYFARLSRAMILSAESASNFTMPSPSSILISEPIRPLLGPVIPFT